MHNYQLANRMSTFGQKWKGQELEPGDASHQKAPEGKASITNCPHNIIID